MPFKFIKIIIWILFTGAVFFLALIDLEAYVSADFARQDGIRHVLVFAAFLVLSKFSFPRLNLIVLILISFMAGIMLEFSQDIFTGGERRFQYSDIMNNTFGIAVGAMTVILYQYVRKKFANS